jgi:hypothetical protein
MIKQLIIRSLLVLSPVAASSQETRVPLTDKVSVGFPEKPSLNDMRGMASIHTVKLADSTADFIAVVSNLQKSSGLTAGMLESAQSAPEFMDQLQAGFMGQLGPDAKVLSKEVKEIGGNKVLCLSATTERNGRKSELSVYLFVHDVYSINIVHRKRTDGASVDAKNAFFESLRIAE